MINKKCEFCNNEFKVSNGIERNKPRRFCSKKCADEVYLFKKGHQVKHEWKEKIIQANTGRKHPEISGQNHHKWKGGRIKNCRGYVIKYCPGHPFAAYKNKSYILEHRLIYENWLRKHNPKSSLLIKYGNKLYLKKEAVVHHKDGNTSNNIILNLKGFINNKEHLKDGRYLELICCNCGKKFKRVKSYIRGKEKHFCNIECFRINGK